MDGIIYGVAASCYLSVSAFAKMAWDMYHGKDTFFSRAFIPFECNKIKNEIEFQEFLRTRREILEKEKQSQLETQIGEGSE